MASSWRICFRLTWSHQFTFQWSSNDSVWSEKRRSGVSTEGGARWFLCASPLRQAEIVGLWRPQSLFFPSSSCCRETSQQDCWVLGGWRPRHVFFVLFFDRLTSHTRQEKKTKKQETKVKHTIQNNETRAHANPIRIPTHELTNSNQRGHRETRSFVCGSLMT